MKYRNILKQRLSGRHYACAEATDYTNKKILNIGCGNGIFESLVSDKAKEVVGVDIKTEDLMAAKEECKALRNVSFVEAGILKDGFPESSCDVVTLFDVIEHLPEGSELEALRKIHDTLKPKGQIVISTPLENATKYLDPAWYLPRRHRHYTKEQLVELLVAAGFEVEKIYTRGGFFEMSSMFLFYPFKWILNMEIPFKKFFDKQREREYKIDEGYVTLFAIAKSEKL